MLSGIAGAHVGNRGPGPDIKSFFPFWAPEAVIGVTRWRITRHSDERRVVWRL